MSSIRLRRLVAQQVPILRRNPVDAHTLAEAATIVAAVREGGETALRQHAERLDALQPGAALVYDHANLTAARDALPSPDRELLERTADRIRDFATQQRACLLPLRTNAGGMLAGHDVSPVDVAGCYAPGGRFPLPSSVLMTAVTARAAGVPNVWVASPRPAPATLAAAAIAGADALLAAGGAQAIAALAYGVAGIPPCDAIVGPGNRWVTAAKQLVAGQVAIDMLAGPSELVVLADGRADPATIAADLLAQAEHDEDAIPALITTDPALADAVDRELEHQLRGLPTATTARKALENGFTVAVPDTEAGIALCDQLAPEHLQLHLQDAPAVAPRLRHYGALFIGSGAAEVFGDYGAGPNHVLPTGGTARSTGGLSVLTFLRVRTWLQVDDPASGARFARDAADLARLEGLEAHARAAERRRG